MKILIVDDDRVVVESCLRILAGEEILAVAAKDVVNAQEMMGRNGAFDLILTDIKMPLKDGFYLMCWVKERYPDVKILMMTGYLTPETIERGKKNGIDGFIAKPFTPDELIRAVNDAGGRN